MHLPFCYTKKLHLQSETKFIRGSTLLKAFAFTRSMITVATVMDYYYFIHAAPGCTSFYCTYKTALSLCDFSL